MAIKQVYKNDKNEIEIRQNIFSDYLTPGLSLANGKHGPELKDFIGAIKMNAFSGKNKTTEAFFTVHILHDIKVNSIPTFHIHWSHNNETSSGSVKWQIEVTSAKGYEEEIFSSSVILSSVSEAGEQYSHHITNDDDMPLPTEIVSSIEPDMILLCRIFRDPTDENDTFAKDAYLLHVDLHYEIGQAGTIERNRPFTSIGL